jgi:hypothetical protein
MRCILVLGITLRVSNIEQLLPKPKHYCSKYLAGGEYLLEEAGTEKEDVCGHS